MSRTITESDKKRYRALFDALDVNNDGKIQCSELAQALRQRRLSADKAKHHAQSIFGKINTNNDSFLDFEEFIEYMIHHEANLLSVFKKLDKNKDGRIDLEEMRQAFKKLELDLSNQMAESLLEQIDKDGNMSVDWQEWMSFFEFSPDADFQSMVRYWRQSLMIDIGEQMTVPPEFTAKEKKSGEWLKHLIAGAVAGAVSRTCTAPLDRVKIMLQVHGKTMSIAKSLQLMVREGGIKSLWRGNGTNVIKIAPETAIKFAAYEKFKSLIQSDPTQIGTLERFAAGSLAGATAQTSIYPMEVVKTRLAIAKTGKYKGMLDCLIQTAKHEGPKALYRGYLPNILGIIPYAGIDLSVYETLKQFYNKSNPGVSDPGVLVLLACGTVSSTCGQLASYPLALVRTRLQAAPPEVAKDGMVKMAQNIVKKNGLRGLYSGIAPNFMKVLPAVSISYVIYERAKKALTESM